MITVLRFRVYNGVDVFTPYCRSLHSCQHYGPWFLISLCYRVPQIDRRTILKTVRAIRIQTPVLHTTFGMCRGKWPCNHLRRSKVKALARGSVGLGGF